MEANATLNVDRIESQVGIEKEEVDISIHGPVSRQGTSCDQFLSPCCRAAATPDIHATLNLQAQIDPSFSGLLLPGLLSPQ